MEASTESARGSISKNDHLPWFFPDDGCPQSSHSLAVTLFGVCVLLGIVCAVQLGFLCYYKTVANGRKTARASSADALDDMEAPLCPL